MIPFNLKILILPYMPQGYLDMKHEFMRKGMSEKAAATKAAKIWNSKHKGGETVGRGREDKGK
jgi:hypothetical protein